MNGEDIGKLLGISRQAVSMSIKKSLRKMYKYVLKKYADGPFDAAVQLSIILGMKTQEDINEFIDILPEDIRREIKDDAKNNSLF